MTRRLLALLLATGLTALLVGLPVSGLVPAVRAEPCTASAPFPDVTISHPFCAEIAWMRDRGISTGFGDGTYKPASDVTRQAMSAFMARLAGASLTTCTAAPFTDVATTHPFCREITWMKSSGISTGFADGTYKPSAVVTRQAMSAFMARLAGVTLSPCTVAPFSDVATSHPFCKEIGWMKSSGVSTGFADGTYKPSANVTRQAMSAFMKRVSAIIDDGSGGEPQVPEATTVLLVASKTSLSATEQDWLDDMSADLGDVDTLAYRDADAETLGLYLTIFVIGQHADLDPQALAAAYADGRTIHLIGPASAYQAQVVGTP
jgi:hypothetical protein